ncbi:hypothetical protein ABFV99_13910 [Cytobacillus horneckiae]|uniref:hypothetical protein n=1 Tax=Cytobacillus horneckiae TaxID=549687 RepID=UPI0034CE7039
MSYELVLIPMVYTGHLIETGLNSHSKCVMCQEGDLQLLDEFINIAGIIHPKAEYEGIFSICPECSTAHLELLTGSVDFKGPILIGWDN